MLRQREVMIVGIAKGRISCTSRRIFVEVGMSIGMREIQVQEQQVMRRYAGKLGLELGEVREGHGMAGRW